MTSGDRPQSRYPVHPYSLVFLPKERECENSRKFPYTLHPTPHTLHPTPYTLAYCGGVA
ncbi:MAG: hypothetical protein F6J93_32685 [Oscillatoria sp. SIO1A7]|nr:hypothetical protein [Oscillatoria sp. SIO1A7]